MTFNHKFYIKAIYTNSVFRSKLMFGIETWGGAQKSKINQVQALQDQATKLALPSTYYKLTSGQRHKVLKWLPIEKEATRATLILTHKILNTGIPQEITSQMPPNTKSLRIMKHNKLGTKPRWLGANKVNKASFRNRSYVFNTLTWIPDIPKGHKEI